MFHVSAALERRRDASTHIQSSSWPRRRSSPRPWWGRCSRSRCWSGWSWWSTARWCRPSPCWARLPTSPSRWRWSGTASPPKPPGCRASCPHARSWSLHRWPRSRRCCTWSRKKHREAARPQEPNSAGEEDLYLKLCQNFKSRLGVHSRFVQYPVELVIYETSD